MADAAHWPALPEQVRGKARINWHVTAWCNYSCEYCPVTVFHTRSKTGQAQVHSFDHYSVEQWLGALRGFPQEEIHLKMSGGEPFLDRQNFRDLLLGLRDMQQMRIGIDSNGYWDPGYFADVDKSQMWLNISYHPHQVEFEEFLPNLLRIRDAGFRVIMVNYVLAPENIDRFEGPLGQLEAEGFFVNLSTLIHTGVYISRDARQERELELVEKYNTPLDVHYKVFTPDAKGRLCYYPAMTYYLEPDGKIRVNCMDGTVQNLFEDGIPDLPRTAVPCEYQECIGCCDMYRSMDDEPRYDKPLTLYTLEDYAAEVSEFRREREARESKTGIAAFVDRLSNAHSKGWLKREVSRHKANAPLVQIGPALAALPEGAVFGAPDQKELTARSRDRISISGWAGSRDSDAPVDEVALRLMGESFDKELGVIRDFFVRPDIAQTYGREDLARSGWRSMIYLPKLRHGEYELRSVARDARGNVAELPVISVRIVD